MTFTPYQITPTYPFLTRPPEMTRNRTLGKGVYT